MIENLANLLLLAVAPNVFSMTLPVSPETAEGQRLISARAVEICAGRYPHLGRYRFEGTETLTGEARGQARFEVQQELECMDAPPAEVAADTGPADWQPSAQDVRLITELTMRYFALLDAGNTAEATRLWSADQQAEMSPERLEQLRTFRREAGRPGDHQIRALTWYVNPENAPRPGIYAAADYERRYSELAFNCGYLIWFREAEGRYVIVREETNSFPRTAAASEATIREARSQFGCRDR